jgi:hypothetical protein
VRAGTPTVLRLERALAHWNLSPILGGLRAAGRGRDNRAKVRDLQQRVKPGPRSRCQGNGSESRRDTASRALVEVPRTAARPGPNPLQSQSADDHGGRRAGRSDDFWGQDEPASLARRAPDALRSVRFPSVAVHTCGQGCGRRNSRR